MRKADAKLGLPVVVLLTLILNHILVPCAMAKEDHGAPGAVVDLATAMITQKDVVVGVKEYTKQKYDDWIWQSIGGYEDLWTGRLTGEAYVVQVQKKVSKYMEIIDAIQNFTLAVEAGRYDEAAFISIDQAVSTIDHPLVSVTWAMAKLTYESHKAVQETGAAVLIEQLFGALHRDRQLFGSQDGEMAQIREDSQTVDYFFDKYIVTDANTRAMVKAYVQTRLGEEWPEQSWSSWLSSLRTIGSGVDVTEAEEIEALTGEWRNVARRWIFSIIRDVNLEARKWYHQARLNQQKAAFEAFAAQYRTFGYELPRLIQMYGNAARIRADLASYNDLLATNTTALQMIQADLSRMSPVNPAMLNQLYSDAMTYKREALDGRAAMLTIDEFALAEAFERLEHQWGVLTQKINARMPTPPSSVGEAIRANPVSPGPSDDYNDRIDSYINFWFEDILAISVPDVGEMEAYRVEFLKKLNSRESTIGLSTSFGLVRVYNGIELAEEVRGRWNSLRPPVQFGTKSSYSWTFHGQTRLLDAIDKRMYEIANEVGPDHPLTGDSNGSLMHNLGLRVRDIYHNVVYPTAYAYFDDLDRWMAEQLEAARILRDTRATQYAATISLYNEVDRLLRQAAQIPDRWMDNPQGDPLGFDDYLDRVRGQLYTYYTGVDYDTYNLVSTLQWHASAILDGWSDGAYDYWFECVSKYKVAVSEAEELFRKIKIPSGSEIDEIRFFVAESSDIESGNRLARAVSAAKSYTSSLPAGVIRMRQMLDTDYNNRKADANWLLKISDEWRIWIDSQLQKGYIERFGLGGTENDIFLLRLPEGMALAGAERVAASVSRPTDGMVMTLDPYPHFMTEAEISSLATTMRARANWSASSAYRFISQYAPETAERFNEMLQFQRVGNYPATMPLITSAEPNFVHPRFVSGDAKGLVNNPNIVWESNLKRAMGMLDSLSYKNRDYEERLTEIRDLLPATLAFASATEQTDYRERTKRGEPVDYTKMSLMLNDTYRTPQLIPQDYDLERLKGFALGEMYAQFCNRLQEILDRERRDRQAEFEKEMERRQPFYALSANVHSTIDRVEQMISAGEYGLAVQYNDYLQLYTDELRSLTGPDPDNMVTDALHELGTLLDEARERLAEAERQAAQVVEKIKAFYDAFARAYESRNTSAVLRLIDSDWEAADGSDTWDLEDTLDRNFRVYDEIRYRVTNIEVLSDLDEGRYLVSYELSIVSRIFARNLKHEENSTVEEEIRIDSRGSGKILKTRRGQFWR